MMNRRTAASGLLILLLFARGSIAAERLPPIEGVVTISPQRAIQVNGKPFFPLMAWLQDAANFAAVKQCGMNTTAGYHPRSSGTKDVAEYLTLVEKAGLYGVMPFDVKLKGRAGLLAYIHDDEPDLTHPVSDAEVIAGPGMHVNRSTPLWKLVDGVTHSWSVLDPMQGASVTIRLKSPVTVQSVAVWQTISPGLAVAKEVTFSADGREILEATLEAKRGQQKFPLAKPATFKELTLAVRSTYPGKNEWGSLGEIEAFGADGRNVLLAPPRDVPRATPEEVLEKYRAIRAADPSRPVFMTLTGDFHPRFTKWSDAERQRLYGGYVNAADVVGYDIYPIYGWNKPEWLDLNYEATRQLAAIAGGRPVYAWIETSKGGQWTGPLERQKDVTPRHIRAEVWMAICGGATGIGYFTHVWKPSYQQFGVPEENREAIRKVNQQITRLAPAILAPPSKAKVAITAEGAKLGAMAKQYEGRLYVFAVNYDGGMKRAAAVVHVENLPEGAEVTVIDEDRVIRSQAGFFRDVFEPLAVHLYQIP